MRFSVWLNEHVTTRLADTKYKQNLTKQYQIKFLRLRKHNMTLCDAYTKHHESHFADMLHMDKTPQP